MSASRPRQRLTATAHSLSIVDNCKNRKIIYLTVVYVKHLFSLHCSGLPQILTYPTVIFVRPVWGSNQ